MLIASDCYDAEVEVEVLNDSYIRLLEAPFILKLRHHYSLSVSYVAGRFVSYDDMDYTTETINVTEFIPEG